MALCITAMNRFRTGKRWYILIVIRSDRTCRSTIGNAQLTLTQFTRNMRRRMRCHGNVADQKCQQQSQAKLSIGKRHVSYRPPKQVDVPG
jgi:hypothetical protein